jgi:hypothetical protein
MQKKLVAVAESEPLLHGWLMRPNRWTEQISSLLPDAKIQLILKRTIVDTKKNLFIYNMPAKEQHSTYEYSPVRNTASRLFLDQGPSDGLL